MKPTTNIKRSELHQTCTGVYAGTRQLPIKEQRGRRYVNFKGKQINIKEIPELEIKDVVFDYVFNGTFKTAPSLILDMCAILRCSTEKEVTFYKNRESFGIAISFNEFKKKAIQLQKEFKAAK